MLLHGRTVLSVGIALLASFVGGQLATAQSERKLAPDALNIIHPSVEYGETHQGPVDLPLAVTHPELKWQPNTAAVSETLVEMSKNVTFRNTVYCLQFAFKPVRTIQVEVNTPEGLQRKMVWYLLYRVTYLGNDYQPTVEKDKFDNAVFGKPDAVSAKWVRFMPNFRLETKGLKSAINNTDQSLLDQVLPAAVSQIAAVERVSPLYDSLTIQRQRLDIGQSLWGVATWIDVDPNTDFFTVVVKGLTNAQRIELDGQKLKYKHKALVLNFFRPGDTSSSTGDTIQYGVPAVNRLAGLRDELSKVLSNRDSSKKEKVFDFELSVAGGLDGNPTADVPSQVLSIAEIVQQMGGQDIRTYSQTGTVLFSLKNGAGQEGAIQDGISRQLGLQVQVIDRASRLGDVIRQAEEAKDEARQNYILQQFGLKERLDHFWTYR